MSGLTQLKERVNIKVHVLIALDLKKGGANSTACSNSIADHGRVPSHRYQALLSCC
jgi:hypothetical protein